MNNRNISRILVFFTYNVSLKIWFQTGLLDREIKIYRDLAKKGYKITFLTYGDKTDLKYKHLIYPIKVVPIYSAVKKSKLKFFNFLNSFLIPIKLKSVFKDNDIYKTNQMYGSWVAVIAKCLYKKKLVVRCGFEWLFFQIRKKDLRKIIPGYFLEHIAYFFADKIFISSHTGKEFVTKYFLVSNSKILVHPNYIDTEKFNPKLKKDYNYFHEKRILFVGRLSKVKNIENIIKAISKTPYGLDIIGQGPEKSKIEKLIQEKKIDVRLLGVVPNNKLPDIIKQYPVFILPSFYEGNPKSLIEAMCCGRAVIGSLAPGIKDIIRNEYNGLTCGWDENSIQNSITKLMENKELQRKLGKNAMEYAYKYFALQKIAANESQVYKSML